MISQADQIILSMMEAGRNIPAQPPPLHPVYIVTWRGYPLSFHTNVCGYSYCVVAEEEATRFDTEAEARAKAGRHGLAWDEHCTVIRYQPEPTNN